ncbi:hypothetical protein K435DRAFT_966199 [Dendrothele bispora CBS 962.96]|uniref:G-protein coupled receptors family 2 profile 2 domain-containing protein n=1 Tax=Dendrothele bispora (strain CBS 962.96) TaxID=1314807 RepID=A0A4S8M1L7_DENBC|nr:hypothetical protein K435DRAFT_966199 [Dendrothele bispora CBS 962.96]
MPDYMDDEKTNTSNQLWAITSAVGAGLCFLVLVMIFLVWLHPKSRPCLDRVSWRIVVWALAANMVFAIASAVGGQLTESAGFLCGFSIFVLQLMLQFSSFLLFSIALNLQLVVVHNFRGQQLEKFYIAVSATMAIILAVPPYATGIWDPLENDCWYSNDNPKTRLTWQISTQMLWTALTALGEIIASGVVIIWMLRHNSHMRQTFAFTSTFSGTSSSSSQNKINDTTPHVIRSVDYRRIVLRIALYPLASCFVNLLSIFTALHSTVAGGIHNSTDYNILLLSDFLYGGRAIVYALLAASDPAFIRGAQVFIKHVLGKWRTRQPSTSTVDNRQRLARTSHGNIDNKGLSEDYPSLGPVVHIELSRIVHHDLGQNMSKHLEPSSTNDRLNDSDATNKMVHGKDFDQETLPPSSIQFKDPNVRVSPLQDMEHDGTGRRTVQIFTRQRKDNKKQGDEAAEDPFWKNI